MKKLLTAALLGPALLALAGDRLHSHLLVEAGQQFTLGGGQPGAFTVAAENVGPVPVQVQERPLSGPVLLRGTLAPRQKARLRFAPGSAALIVNQASRQAVLELDVKGSIRALNMVSTPVKL